MEQERVEAAIRHSQEMEKEKKEREMSRLRSKLKSKLPKEPREEKEEGKPVSKLRFRVPVPSQDEDSDELKDNHSALPNGMVSATSASPNNQIERRFLASETLQTVLDYLTTEGYPSSDFKVLSSWPRRDVSTILIERYVDLITT